MLLLPGGDNEIRGMDGPSTAGGSIRKTLASATEPKIDENEGKVNVIQLFRNLDTGEEPSHCRRAIQSTSVRALRHDVRTRAPRAMPTHL